MASRPAFYPDSHARALERVMRVIDLIAGRPDITDEEAVAALMREGVGEVDVVDRVRAVRSVFRTVEAYGDRQFPSSCQVRNCAGQWVELRLANEHYFSAALGVGQDVTTRGYTEPVSKETFQAVISRSARFAPSTNTLHLEARANR
jgi:hypothetical protein